MKEKFKKVFALDERNLGQAAAATQQHLKAVCKRKSPRYRDLYIAKDGCQDQDLSNIHRKRLNPLANCSMHAACLTPDVGNQSSSSCI